MLPTIYIETTIVSYLVARPSRDAIMAERQRQTREWWEHRRGKYKLFSSELVRREVSRGEAVMAQRRLEVLDTTALLMGHVEVEELAEALVSRGPLPAKAHEDAWHISTATVYGLDYLLTWNCKHIANPRTFIAIERLCRERGFTPPRLCTPRDLLKR